MMRRARACGPSRCATRARGTWALFAACVALVALAIAPAVAQERASGPIAVEEYAARVSAARSAIAGAEGDLTAPARAASVSAEVRTLVPAAAEVSAGDAVLTVDGSTVAAPAGDLASAGDAVGRRDAGAALDAHLASLERALGVPGEGSVAHDPEVLAGVLADLGVRGRSPLEQWIEEQWARIAEAVQRFVDSLLADGSGGAGVARWVFFATSVAGGLVVLWLVFVVVRRWLRATAPEARLVAGVPLGDAPVVAAAEGLPDDVVRYADEAAAEGRYRDAVRALFGGAARSLVERGVVEHTRTRTNAELVADVRSARPVLHRPLQALRSVFEPAWYGHEDPGQDGYRLARSTYDELLAAVGGGGA
ncbi:MAG: DUF4129 domain-containing protein [Aeromicrobium sp.]|nr:DUF4129 domain-containing protein [Aeromicrobium sp.]